MKIDLIQDSPEWHAWRKSGIGSSDIAKIMGVSPFGSAIDVYNEKSGLSENKPTSFAMNYGKINEPKSREKFNKTENARYSPACFQHRDYPHFLASVDGYDPETNSIIEIKTPGKKDLMLAMENKIPEYYNVQIQWQLFVSGCLSAFYVVYDPLSDNNYSQHIFRDPIVIEDTYNAAHQFWSNYERGVPPEKQKKDFDFFTEAEYEQLELIEDDYIMAKATYDQAAKYLEQCKQEIIRCNQGFGFKTPRLTVARTDPRITYDIEAMKKDGFDLNQYQKKGENGWRITINR